MRGKAFAIWTTSVVAGLCASSIRAQVSSPNLAAPISLQQRPESIYAPPAPPREDQGVNEGAVHMDFTVRYMTDYVYRGIDRSEIGGREDAPNLQFDGKVDFDLGKFPHPYVNLFVNVYDSDPISRFQEVRPVLGFDWPIRPLTFSGGNITYIFPDRDEINTSEAFVKIALDDAFVWSTERPIFQPYALVAYDYDLYNGWYFEIGMKHDFIFEDTGFKLTFVADVGYSMDNEQFRAVGSTSDTGFQHYDVGLIGQYSLNTLFNFPRRYGEFSLEAYLYYTDGIDNDLSADTQIWGGVGMNFKY
ncbi:MAG: hypothetical protein H7Z14_05655 [Anaerolineae bacterium]|nr:hypothetical protein [Phycisphaerae bacterium]